MKIFGLLFRIILWSLVIGASWHAVKVWNSRPRIALVRLWPQANFVEPIMVRVFPDQKHYAIVEKAGRILVGTKQDSSAPLVILDIREHVYSLSEEEGLLSVAFDPKFEDNHYAYLFYSLDQPLRSRISRVKIGPDLVAEPKSEFTILEFAKPSRWHNGGQLEFGPDGYLYITVGEGNHQSRADADRILPSRTTLLGTILRIDVKDSSDAHPYVIPRDNPFIAEQDGVRREIWAYGFRNPWRLSFDRVNSELYAIDVGGVKFEEVNRILPGRNYGWPIMEGEGCHYSTDHGKCDRAEKEIPIGSFSHESVLLCITGGFVYHGQALPDMKGKFIFSGLEDGLFAMDIPAAGEIMTKPTRLFPAAEIIDGKLTEQKMRLSSLSEDQDGELILTNLRGPIYQLAPTSMQWLVFFDSLLGER